MVSAKVWKNHDVFWTVVWRIWLCWRLFWWVFGGFWGSLKSSIKYRGWLKPALKWYLGVLQSFSAHKHGVRRFSHHSIGSRSPKKSGFSHFEKCMFLTICFSNNWFIHSRATIKLPCAAHSSYLRWLEAFWSNGRPGSGLIESRDDRDSQLGTYFDGSKSWNFMNFSSSPQDRIKKIQLWLKPALKWYLAVLQ